MNIVEKVNNREITPRHNNYQEVTIDAAGNGPVINFNGVHARTSGLQGFSPLKQSIEYNNKKANSEKVPEKSWYDKFSSIGHGVLDVAGMVPVFGAAADLINAGWYAGEGYAQDKGYLDETGAGEGAYQNALISTAAAVPGAGQYATIGKYAMKGFKGASKPIMKYAKNNKALTAFDAALGTDMAQTSYEDYDKEFGDGSFKKSYSPFFGSENNEGVIPYVAKKYYEYDAKDGEEGNVLSQGFNDLKGGISNLLNKNNSGATDTDNNASSNTSEQSKPTKSNRPQKFIDYYKNKNKNN